MSSRNNVSPPKKKILFEWLSTLLLGVKHLEARDKTGNIFEKRAKYIYIQKIYIKLSKFEYPSPKIFSNNPFTQILYHLYKTDKKLLKTKTLRFMKEHTYTMKFLSC